jgi:hypothetical protein
MYTLTIYWALRDVPALMLNFQDGMGRDELFSRLTTSTGKDMPLTISSANRGTIVNCKHILYVSKS